MRKKLWLVLSLAALLSVLGLAGCSTLPTSNQSTGIIVSGKGKVSVVPDLAVLSLGVQAMANTVEQAQSQASAAMNAVVNAVKAEGVADKDIKTQYYSIQQITRYDPSTQQQEVTGYSVTNTATVKVRSVADTGAIIDAVAKAGGDNTRINSLSFTIDDPANYENSARQLAIAEASAKAKQIADLAGVKLGNAIYITESGGYIPLPSKSVNVSAPDAGQTPISAGEMEITMTVQITYSIK
jgi:hypothetical protein